VLEDGLGGGGAKDDGDDAAGAPAARADEDVGLEGALEEVGPGDGTAGLPWADGLGCHRADRCLCQRRRRGDDAGPHPCIGGEDTEVAHQVGSRWRDERGHPAEEGHRCHDEVRLSGGRGPLHPVGKPSVAFHQQPSSPVVPGRSPSPCRIGWAVSWEGRAGCRLDNADTAHRPRSISCKKLWIRQLSFRISCSSGGHSQAHLS